MRYQVGLPKVLTFEEVVATLAGDEFRKGVGVLRSTIPMLAYWRNLQAWWGSQNIPRIPDLEHGTAYFEYVVPSLQRAKGSHTDVMFVSERVAIAFEAKCTEPSYETVDQWLHKGTDRQFREKVRDHWIDLIEPKAGSVDRAAIASCEYQLLHRVASACSMGRGDTHVVYQFFQIAGFEGDLSCHQEKLQRFTKALASESKLQIWLSIIPAILTNHGHELHERIKSKALSGEKRVAAIRDGIIQDRIFTFPGTARTSRVTRGGS